jgi:putative pyruvate formate lyase activating enzyme
MLPESVLKARKLLTPCRLCPRFCGALRRSGQKGFCGVADKLRVASAGAHFGEESVLTGKGGSGTIFLGGCNLRCVYCQNYRISSGRTLAEMPPAQLAQIMIELQRARVSNINLVTPTHVAPMLLEAIVLARRLGLKVPVVYNCGGYESVEMLVLLEGYVDIYLPDFKYGSAQVAAKYSQAPDYPEKAELALAEMFRQVGPLRVGASGLACSGVLVRHLVLPLDLACSQQVVDTVARVAPGTAINIMGQYRPCHQACAYPELLLMPESAELERLRNYAQEQGLIQVNGQRNSLQRISG